MRDEVGDVHRLRWQIALVVSRKEVKFWRYGCPIQRVDNVIIYGEYDVALTFYRRVSHAHVDTQSHNFWVFCVFVLFGRATIRDNADTADTAGFSKAPLI